MTRRTASALVVSGLERSFGGHPVLRGVDLEVRDGVTAVLGASGCGKTTLLRLVAGFLHPDAGTIVLDGATVAGAGIDVPSRRRRIGYVPQEGALFPHLDVAGNVGFGLPRAERRHGSRRVAEVLELVGLAQSYATRYPHELSGGQQQRVALARALASEPTLVLLDEPFSSLDASLREETGRAVARALHASGSTGVLVTHDRSEAMSLADQLAVMADGRFLQVGPPEEVYLAPANLQVASLVTDAVLLEARVVDGRAQTPLGTLCVEHPGPGAHPRDLAAVLAIRQEQLVLTPGRLPGSNPPAVVREVAFLGQHATVRAVLEGTDLTIGTRVPTVDAPHPGDTVTVAVAGPVRAFPREPRP
jgi:iron(III) transport system ATP-binding protein